MTDRWVATAFTATDAADRLALQTANYSRAVRAGGEHDAAEVRRIIESARQLLTAVEQIR